MAIDFTRYQPPGVYTESVGGPQLAVRSTVPTAVAIYGQGVGYRTHRESVKIAQDTTVSGTLVAGSSKQLAKKGIKVVEYDIKAYSATNINLVTPGTSVGGVTLAVGDYVQLYGQTSSAENGLYRWNAASSTVSAPAMTLIPDTFKVVDPTTGVAKVRGKDYVITRVAVGDDSSNTVPGKRDDVYVLKRVRASGTTIEEGDVVQVSYRYTDPEYYQVWSLYDYDDVRDIYGEPFDASGNIQSEITLAAKFAYMNGASTVLTCAVDRESVYPSSSSNAGQTKTIADQYQDALDKLSDEDQIAVIVPATGNAEFCHDQIKQHVNLQSANRYERRAIIGIDGSSTRVPSSSRVEFAETLSERRVALISPSQFLYYAPELSKQITLGGQFMAAAVAGRSVSQIAAMPLTRKTISGFIGPSTEDIGREGEKNNETQNGLMVVERTRRNQVQVRHGVTTDPTDMLTREWSIIGQQDVMVYRVRDYLDADGLIGMPIYDTTLIQVKASAESALVSLVRDGIIVGYQNLKVRQIATLPDVIEVRYEWKPAYPLNYIVVRYSVAVMTGDVTVSEATT
jgi:hypothetical protein